MRTKTVIKLTVQELEDQYPAVYAANKDRLAKCAEKGRGSIRLAHAGQWLEVSC